MNTNEATEFGMWEITPADQVPKMTLADGRIRGQRLEIEELGPGWGGCCGTAANLRSVRFYSA